MSTDSSLDAPTEGAALPIGSARRSRALLPPVALAGFLGAFGAVLLIAFFGYQSLESRARTADSVRHTQEVVEGLKSLVTTLIDAETSQRGFLLTGVESYLEPYERAKAALPGLLARLKAQVSDNPSQTERLATLDPLAREKIDELGARIALRRAGKGDTALALIRANRGKAAMDVFRAGVAEMEAEERKLFTQRQREWQKAVDASSWVIWGGSALLLVLIGIAAALAARDYRSRENEVWLRAGQIGLSRRLLGDQMLNVLGPVALDFLARYMNAQVGAIYIAEGAEHFRRFGSYALPPERAGEVLRRGDGLLGEAVRGGRLLHVRDVPEGYLPISSAVGSGSTRELLVAPLMADGMVHAVIELGFFRAVDTTESALLERISQTVGIAVRSAKDRTRLQELLEETQRQSEELQSQQEELRVNNEELEEQGRALKESQARMETQQAELEQTNSQLEEQAQMLEAQKDDLARSEADLSQKAAELERSNQYKSEFLANMSHELRTPLNSTLILAKLLADNKRGNLDAEQIQFAKTISSAGNDLLALINDILELSKIEAGKVEVHVEPVPVAGLVDALTQSFGPMAKQKGLRFSAETDPGLPVALETDGQRLGQVLRNLLSNAVKFTEQGEVTLRVAPAAGGRVSFAVQDSGIGISSHQQEVIFEAFRQVDGSDRRKFGGTGLGLSISRDLARLLGGEVVVHSLPGKGSTFTLTIPIVFGGRTEFTREPARVAAGAIAPPAPAPRPHAKPAAAPAATPSATDDRDRIAPNGRVILVVEDDERFAAILQDLAHELDFQCVLAHSANDGLAAAVQYLPSAIVLDMNLPDYSGLGVLDQLKRNPLTRHIPVHVVSVADYSHEAMELGAIGYALKPVKREELVEAFQRLEAKFSQGMRRVLVVEDDERQRDSIRQLLANEGVEITAVARAAEALDRLQATAYDCIVMDFSLPDLDGLELLNRMVEQAGKSLPPVIVYTGRSLSADEEQRLRRFSKSIIIKDARSPERLLDEVTLFLHQVEAKLPVERQRMLQAARDREAALENRRVLVVEDDARNIFALSSVLEPKGVRIEIARNGKEALFALERAAKGDAPPIDLVLMDIMMPEMDGMTAMREIRKRPAWAKLPIIALTAKAMKDDQEKCLAAGANDYIAKPLDVDKLLSLVRVWMPK